MLEQWRSVRWKEQLTPAPTPHPSELHRAEKVEESRLKLSPGRRDGGGEGVFNFVVISHYPTLLLSRKN